MGTLVSMLPPPAPFISKGSSVLATKPYVITPAKELREAVALFLLVLTILPIKTLSLAKQKRRCLFRLLCPYPKTKNQEVFGGLAITAVVIKFPLVLNQVLGATFDFHILEIHNRLYCYINFLFYLRVLYFLLLIRFYYKNIWYLTNGSVKNLQFLKRIKILETKERAQFVLKTKIKLK